MSLHNGTIVDLLFRSFRHLGVQVSDQNIQLLIDCYQTELLLHLYDECFECRRSFKTEEEYNVLIHRCLTIA